MYVLDTSINWQVIRLYSNIEVRISNFRNEKIKSVWLMFVSRQEEANLVEILFYFKTFEREVSHNIRSVYFLIS